MAHLTFCMVRFIIIWTPINIYLICNILFRNFHHGHNSYTWVLCTLFAIETHCSFSIWTVPPDTKIDETEWHSRMCPFLCASVLWCKKCRRRKISIRLNIFWVENGLKKRHTSSNSRKWSFLLLFLMLTERCGAIISLSLLSLSHTHTHTPMICFFAKRK